MLHFKCCKFVDTGFVRNNPLLGEVLSRKQVSHVAEKRVVLDLLWLGNWFAHMEGGNRRDRDNPKQISTVLELDHLNP